jgi:3-hydroxyisobutyrate dehydrogenase-like beta-hydroxyacid dehydrogenase
VGVPGFARVALVGCGHIGGSWALALRRASPTVHVRGFDADAGAAARALALGVVDALAEDVGVLFGEAVGELDGVGEVVGDSDGVGVIGPPPPPPPPPPPGST